MAIVFQFVGCVDPSNCSKGELTTVSSCALDFQLFTWFESFCDPGDREAFFTGQSQADPTLAIFELQWQYTHSDEVAAMNALKTFSNNSFNTQKISSLGCPVATGSSSIFFSSDNYQRGSFSLIGHGTIINSCDLTFR